MELSTLVGVAQSSQLSRVVLRLVAGALCVAALAAIAAILSGSFSSDDLKVIGTSVLFAFATSTGGAGAGLRLRGTSAVAAPTGTIVLGASAATFGLVTYGMWVEVGNDDFWRTTATIAIIAVDGAHACFVRSRRRTTDPDTAKAATAVAVLAAVVSGTFGILAAVGLAENGPWQALAVVLVIQLLATALAPIFRRGARQQAIPGTTAGPFGAERPGDIGGRLLGLADELENPHSPETTRDVAEELRRLARRSGRWEH